MQWLYVIVSFLLGTKYTLKLNAWMLDHVKWQCLLLGTIRKKDSTKYFLAALIHKVSIILIFLFNQIRKPSSTTETVI